MSGLFHLFQQPPNDWPSHRHPYPDSQASSDRSGRFFPVIRIWKAALGLSACTANACLHQGCPYLLGSGYRMRDAGCDFTVGNSKMDEKEVSSPRASHHAACASCPTPKISNAVFASSSETPDRRSASRNKSN